MNSNKSYILKITIAAMIAAIYVVLTYISNMFGLANGAIQLRISEALCILPFFTPHAIAGITIGCVLSNILTGASIIDIIFGSFASFIGAVGTYYISKLNFPLKKWMASIPPILSNAIIIPFVIAYSYIGSQNLMKEVIPLFISIGISEFVSAGILGTILLISIEKQADKIFPKNL